ncbi:ribonuclease HII [Eggerthellaceae bacterium zg-1084]|uniref:Ribonuclease HII n=1 Tax=Berryella wangjianweii TaxID=2734634 RepID=A0A6M8J5S6_9ACTN|nr:ribonuclease HII [Berryella wangjianweii]NPD31271.1 ribonuclease HII [Berryella wangjianweii]NPD32420.1 ribonuclease HII [Eggerthellaceae bacterium zg-997]QKF06819.1 ribonuclease HII [Berryella wangjianweii]
MTQSLAQIKDALKGVQGLQLEELLAVHADDPRKGVQAAVAAGRRRLQREDAERQRLEGLYRYEAELAGQRAASVVLGLDEVGRGPIAGPLTVAGVVLPAEPRIAGLNDSKQVRPEARESIAACVRQRAHAVTVQFIEPEQIDAVGMAAALRVAFSRAIEDIEAQGIVPDLVLLDGNALRIDRRECNVVKGDARCASIAAASIVAKVARDDLMVREARRYPAYGFDENKGYGSPAHIEAIRREGLCPIHRRSFCRSFVQG